MGAPEIRQREPDVGEGFQADLRKPAALQRNRDLRGMTRDGLEVGIDLGEHGVIPVGDVRFRDSLRPGILLAYIRKQAEEHPRGAKVVVASVAVGVVATATYKLLRKDS